MIAKQISVSILVLMLINQRVSAGALDRWRGGFPAIFSRPTSPIIRPPPPPPPPPPQPTFFQKMTGSISSAAFQVIHTVGSFLPLRGIASLAADIGIPGAATLMDFLTPRVVVVAPRLGTSAASSSALAKPLNHRSTSGRNSGGKGFSPFRAEIQSIVGVAHGEEECLLKLACLSGKRLSALSGASAVAMMLAAATDMMPAGFREPYLAMKNSVMYSDDCSQYVCTKNREDL